MKKQIFLLIGLIGIISVPLCVIAQHTSTHFLEITEIPAGKALVYIYRDGSIGVAVNYTVNANDKPVMKTHLYNGKYMVYFADPGKLELWAETANQRENIVLDVVAGQTYFVDSEVKMGTWVGRPSFTLVPKEKALKKIQKCKLLED
jgi:hypothetical protein